MYKIYEEKIKNLFENYKSQDPELQEIINRKYVYSQFHTGRKVLFIGLNPSFREKQAKKEEYYKSFDATNNNDRYFRRFPLLVENKNDWTFLDLLYIRETRQRNIENFYKREPDFIKQQLEISKEIIKKISAVKAQDLGAIANLFGVSKESGQINLLNPVIGGAIEPKVAGAAFGAGKDKVSQPVQGNSGVYVVINKGVNVNKQPGSVKEITQALVQQNAGIFPQAFMRSLQNSADIEDYRIEVYNTANSGK